MKFDNYYLDLKKVSKIESEEERKQIHRYYTDMMLFLVRVETLLLHLFLIH